MPGELMVNKGKAYGPPVGSVFRIVKHFPTSFCDYSVRGSGILNYNFMENQTAKNMKNDMEAGLISLLRLVLVGHRRSGALEPAEEQTQRQHAVLDTVCQQSPFFMEC